MAEKKKGKKSIKKIVMGAITPILIIVLLASALFAIIEAILQIIIAIVKAIIQAIINFLTDPLGTISRGWAKFTNWFSSLTGWGDDFDPEAYSDKRVDPNIVISKEQFDNMKQQLDNAINRNTAGLDDYMLKRMILAYYRGLYLKDTNILIEIEDNEISATDEIAPFSIIKGDSDKGMGEDGKKYLKAKGSLKVKYKDKDIVYYDEKVLMDIYNREYVSVIEDNEDYAKDALRYLMKCYTYSEKGIKKFCETENVSWEEYEFGSKGIETIEKEQATHQLVEIAYYEKISQYATPMEFMINLMEITGSRDFVNTFIASLDQTNYVELEVLEIEYCEEDKVVDERERSSILTLVDREKEEVKDTLTDETEIKNISHKRYTETKCELVVNEAVTWYAKIEKENYIKETVEFSTQKADGEIVKIPNADSAIEISSVDEYIQYTSEANPKIFTKPLFLMTKEDCLAYHINDIKTNANKSLFNTLSIEDTLITKKIIKEKTTETLIEGPEKETDNTDAFLALLSGPSSTYVNGSRFIAKSNGGKVIRYNDLYRGTVGAGELLENGAELLFDLLDRSENTRGLIDTMRYIMYRYSGKDFGVTEFYFNSFDLNKIGGNNIIIGGNIEEKLWCSLLNTGLSEIAVAGVMGNIYVDSNFNTQIDPILGTGGIGKWQNDRAKNLLSYISAKGVPKGDENAQIEYLIGELTEGGGCERICYISIN